MGFWLNYLASLTKLNYNTQIQQRTNFSNLTTLRCAARKGTATSQTSREMALRHYIFLYTHRNLTQLLLCKLGETNATEELQQ
jgi:hypothetical protein